MKIKLKTLSPVHIGSGEEITPMEYDLNERFNRIDMNSLFSDPDFEPIMEKYIAAAGSQRYIGDQLPHEILMSHRLYSIPIRGNAEDYLEGHQTNVKAFIKSAGRVYIPGSSLKGSILSALIWFVLKEAQGRDKENIKSYMKERGRFNDLLNIAFNNMIRDKRDRGTGSMRFARWIDVSDSNLRSADELMEISLIKIHGAKTGKEQPILYETLKSGVEFELKVVTKNLRFSLQQVLDICDQFYRRVLELDKSENIQSRSNLLRLGQGSSAFATSLLILATDLGFSDYKITPPITRKRIGEHFAMGWVEITNGLMQEGKEKLYQFMAKPSKYAKVFLSHSHLDKPFVEKLRQDLEKLGIDTWYDQKDMVIGDIVSESISEGIKESSFFLIVVSPNSVRSNWVKNELDEAYEALITGGKRILPVLIGNLADSEIPQRLKKHKYADFRDEHKYHQIFEELYNAILKRST